jgi:serine phosphatase RsbU (regulator of sigma subunit)
LKDMSCNTLTRGIDGTASSLWLDPVDAYVSDSPASPGAETPNTAFPAEEVAALYRELFEALQVQRRLSGPRRIRRGQFEITSEVFPIQYFSGDFVIVFDVGDSTFFALGDIAGKGLTAAMWSTHVMSLVRTYSASLKAPGAVLQAINRDLCALGTGTPIVTMVQARLQWQRGELFYSNAGHCLPFVKRVNGDIERLSVGGPALGAIPNSTFETARMDFSAMDVLVGYSDGLIECRNPNGDEFGEERLLDHLRHSAKHCADETLFSMIGVVQDFAAGVERTDDLTLMIVSDAETGRS